MWVSTFRIYRNVILLFNGIFADLFHSLVVSSFLFLAELFNVFLPVTFLFCLVDKSVSRLWLTGSSIITWIDYSLFLIVCHVRLWLLFLLITHLSEGNNSLADCYLLLSRVFCNRSAPNGMEGGEGSATGGPKLNPQQMAAQKRLQQTQAQVDEVFIQSSYANHEWITD